MKSSEILRVWLIIEVPLINIFSIDLIYCEDEPNEMILRD